MKKLIKFFTAVDMLACLALLGYAVYTMEVFWWGMFGLSATFVVLAPAKRIQAAIEKKFLSSKKKELEAQTSGKFFPSQVAAGTSSPGAQNAATPSSDTGAPITGSSFKASPRGYSVILNSPNKHNKLKPEHLNHYGAGGFKAPGAIHFLSGESRKV